jgi:hypothetical protein
MSIIIIYYNILYNIINYYYYYYITFRLPILLSPLSSFALPALRPSSCSLIRYEMYLQLQVQVTEMRDTKFLIKNNTIAYILYSIQQSSCTSRPAIIYNRIGSV